MSNQITIKIEDIPEFLNSSERCTFIDVPEQYFMKTIQIECLEDCVKILNIIDYWGAKHVPQQFWDFLVDNQKEKKEIIEVLECSTKDIAKRILKSLDIITSYHGPTRVKMAIENTDELSVEYLLDHGVYVPINQLMARASSIEQSQWIEQLKTRYSSNPIFTPKYNKWDESKMNRDILCEAIKNSNFEIIKKIVSEGFNINDYQLISSAAYYKNFEIFEYLYENWKYNSDKYYHEYIIESVLQSDSFEMLKYVFEKRNYNVSIITYKLSHIKSIETFKYLVTQGLKITSYNGLERLSYELLNYIFDVNQKESGVTIKQKSYLTFQNISNVTGMNDGLERLKYFVSKGFKLYKPISVEEVNAQPDTEEERQKLIEQFNKNHKTIPIANAIGHHDIPLIEYLLENGLEYPENAMEYVFRNHNNKGLYLEMLKFLNKEGCNWSPEVITRCKYAGYIDCLKYARECGCEEPEDKYTTGQFDFSIY